MELFNEEAEDGTQRNNSSVMKANVWLTNHIVTRRGTETDTQQDSLLSARKGS